MTETFGDIWVIYLTIYCAASDWFGVCLTGVTVVAAMPYQRRQIDSLKSLIFCRQYTGAPYFWKEQRTSMMPRKHSEGYLKKTYACARGHRREQVSIRRPIIFICMTNRRHWLYVWLIFNQFAIWSSTVSNKPARTAFKSNASTMYERLVFKSRCSFYPRCRRLLVERGNHTAAAGPAKFVCNVVCECIEKNMHNWGVKKEGAE